MLCFHLFVEGANNEDITCSISFFYFFYFFFFPLRSIAKTVFRRILNMETSFMFKFGHTMKVGMIGFFHLT